MCLNFATKGVDIHKIIQKDAPEEQRIKFTKIIMFWTIISGLYVKVQTKQQFQGHFSDLSG